MTSDQLAQVLAWLVTITAAGCAAAWADRALRTPAASVPAACLSGWAGLTAVVPVLQAARPDLAARLDWPISLLAGGLATAGLARLLLARRDGILLALASVALLWGLASLAGLPDAVDPTTVTRPLVTLLLALGVLSALAEHWWSGASGSQVAAAAIASTSFVITAIATLADQPQVAAGATVAGFVAAAAVPVLPGPAVDALDAPVLFGPAPSAVDGGAGGSGWSEGLDERRDDEPDAVTAPGLPTRVLPLAVAVAALAVQALLVVLGDRGPARAPGPVAAVLFGTLTLVLVLVRWADVASVDRMARELRAARARLAALVESSTDVVLQLDPHGMIRQATDNSVLLLQRSVDTLIGADPADLVQVDDRAAVRDMVRAVASGRRLSARIDLVLSPPAIGGVQLRLRAVPGGAVATLCDDTDPEQLRDRLTALACRDQVTGLANRETVVETVGSWLEEGRAVAVLHLDLDGFKAVNDRFGHEAGDDVLREVARRIHTHLGGDPRISGAGLPAPLVARVGADEFVIGLSGAEATRAGEVAAEVLDVVRPPFRIGDRAVRLGGGVGIAATRDDRPTLTWAGPGGAARAGVRHEPALPAGTRGAIELLHRADIATFAAKSSTRQRVMVWDAALEERARRKVDIAMGLRRALDTGALTLAYQPIVRLADGVIVGVEALVRVPAGEASGDGLGEGADAEVALDEVVSPAELVEVAEGTGEIDELGRRVLAEATHQAALWLQMRLDVRVSVNMSVRQLSDPTVVEAVRGALAAAHLPPDRLVIEITEGQLLGEGDRADLTIRRLQADGVQLAIDDFGSGYSSLSYLRRMPVKTVKLDRTLLGGVGSDPRATTVVRAVIGAARGLGLQVVCEGIEDLATARFLRDLGAWAGQGFALHTTMSAADLREVLEGPPVDLSGTTRRRRGVPHDEIRRAR